MTEMTEIRAGTNTPAVRRCPNAAAHAARLRRRPDRRQRCSCQASPRIKSRGHGSPRGVTAAARRIPGARVPEYRNHLSCRLFGDDDIPASGGPGHVDAVWDGAHERDRQVGATGQGEAALLTGDRADDRGAQR